MNSKLAELFIQMTNYDSGDPRRVQHFTKVHDFAAVIGQSEKMDCESLFVLEAASILHDIGIHISEEKYNACNGKQQELEGPAEAKKLLEANGNFTEKEIERICFLIGHHHTYNAIDGLDYQILVEADFLVNAYEDSLSVSAIEHFRDRYFKTQTGIQLLNSMFVEKRKKIV